MSGVLVLLGVALFLVGGSAAAQSPIYPEARGTAGAEARSVLFGEGIRLRRASQAVFRFVGGVPIGRRVFVDVSTNYAITELRSVDGERVDLSGFTDTEVRGAYTLGRDVAVFSVQFNVPTGTERVETGQLPLLQAMAQNFLPFPVSNVGTSAGVTGAIAVAQRFGGWSAGVAASVRYLGRYAPFSDDPGIEYSPGVERRLRLGVRRIIDYQTTATAAFTVGNFGEDELTGGQGFAYQPGNRYIGEISLARQIQRSTVRVFAWGFWRAAGDSAGAMVPRAKERIIYAGCVWSLPVSGLVTLDPGVDVRGWRSDGGGNGQLIAGQFAGRVRLTRSLVLAPTVRVERGDIRLSDTVAGSFSGLTAGVLLRATL